MNVDKRIENLRKLFPTAGRAEIHRIIRLEYQLEWAKLECQKHGIFLASPVPKTFLQHLRRRLNAHDLEKTFPEPAAQAKQTETEEETLMRFIKESYPNGVPLYSRTKYRSTINEEDILKDAATVSGNDYTDPRFRRKFAKLKNRWLEEASQAPHASKKVVGKTNEVTK